MHVGLRKLLMVGLVAAFCGQTALVYADTTADQNAPLSEQAIAGRRIWHRHNCQVCHQIFGMGGFLGPDLTNAAPRLTRERLDQILTQGAAQMPAFHLTAEEISAVEAFLRELDRTGVGVARRDAPLDPQAIHEAIATHLDARAAPEPVRRGWTTFEQVCRACHVPLQATPLGLNTAPDLTTVTERLDAAGIAQTIKHGRPERGMPAWPLEAATVDGLVALLQWLGDERAALAARLGDADRTQPLPWWEFK